MGRTGRRGGAPGRLLVDRPRWLDVDLWCGASGTGADHVDGRLHALAPQRRLIQAATAGRSCATGAPRSECGSACVIVTSSMLPTDSAPPLKLTMRLHSVRPISSESSLRLGPSTK